MRKKNILNWCTLLAVLLFCTELAFGAYTLDTAFGDNGQISESFGGISNKGFAVVVQPDGAIIVAGSKSSSADQDFSLIRYLADGSYDSSFNIDGRVVTPIGRADDEILAVGLLADGRIVAAGYSENDTDRDFALACYFPDGSLDTSFGDQGTVLIQIGNGHDEITALTVTPDNQIIIAGVAEGTSGSVIVVGRFYDDGTLDVGFGEEGLSLIGVGDDAVAEGVLVLESGRIVISGSYSEQQKTSLALIGVTVDGVVDAGFGVKGIAVASDVFGNSEGYGITATEEGKIYLAASVENDNQFDAELFCFTADGALDATFNDTGVVSIYAGPEDDALYDVKILNDAKIAFTGFATRSGVRRVLVGTYAVENDSMVVENIESVEETLPQPMQVSSLQVAPGTLSDGGGGEHIQEIQVMDSFDQFLEQQVEENAQTETVVHVRTWKRPVMPLLSSFFSQVVSFFVGEAVAAELENDESVGAEDNVNITILGAEQGDGTGNALSVSDNGDVVVVGTTTDKDATEILTVAKFSSTGQDTDAVTALASATSSYIRTLPVSEITRTGALTGGEILSGLGTVTKKGVVFSIAPYPQYKGSSSSGGSGDEFTVTITNPTNNSTVSTKPFTLSVKTSLSSQCGYNQGTDIGFDSMTKFPGSQATTHSVELSLDDDDYTYYVRCQTTDDKEAVASVSFTVTVTETSTTAMLEKMLRTTGNFLVAEAVAADDDTSESDSGGFFGTSSIDDFVEEGETEDGSGSGRYSSILEKLKPGTTFYVRAYAIVGGTTYYGNELTFRTDDSCFIATASYGSVFHPMVKTLRDFRDSYLLQVEPGRKFVDFYYTVSPPVADLIASRAWMRFIVRLLLLPLVGFSWLALQMGIWQAVGASVTGVLLVGYTVVQVKNILGIRMQH